MPKAYAIGSNQTQLDTSNYSVLYSYKTPVAVKIGRKAYVTNQYHSRTTSRHINGWVSGCAIEKIDPNNFDALTDMINEGIIN